MLSCKFGGESFSDGESCFLLLGSPTGKSGLVRFGVGVSDAGVDMEGSGVFTDAGFVDENSFKVPEGPAIASIVLLISSSLDVKLGLELRYGVDGPLSLEEEVVLVDNFFSGDRDRVLCSRSAWRRLRPSMISSSSFFARKSSSLLLKD